MGANLEITAGLSATQHAVEQFLYRQAALLDGKEWQKYIDLFADDGHYWMPTNEEQTKAASSKPKKEAVKPGKLGLAVGELTAEQKKAWQEKDYSTILVVANKIPEDVLQDDPKLLMWYDQALTRAEK